MGEFYNRYDIDLNIDMSNKFISAISKLSYNCKKENLRELKLYIHKDLYVECISCNKNITYEIDTTISDWCPFILETKLIPILFNEKLYINENIDFIFKYSGCIDIISPYGINRLTNNWVKLGLYTPWFPLTDNMEPALFNINIDIDKDYKIINSKKKGDNLILYQKIPSFDCTILACKDFKYVQNTACEVVIEVYYMNDKYKNIANEINEISTKAIQKYIEFGDVETEKYSIVIAPREDGGGYCRPGLIVVTPEDEFEDKINYFKFIAHELAHIWWNKANANCWEDWLNESFAEYSALIALRDNFKQEDFDKIISSYKEKSKDLPAIRNLSRADENAYKVLYIKGALVLNKLENRIGKVKLKELLKETHLNKINTTDKFLYMVEKICNKEIREFLDVLLN